MSTKYFIRGVFGLTGSGKTTFLARAAARHLKKGYPVFSNFGLLGAYKISVDELGKLSLPCNSLVLLDEISLVCDCREWKNFSSDLVYFFTHHRKLKCSVFWASQNFGDADKKIRNLTDRVYRVVPWYFGFSAAYPVNKVQYNEGYQYIEGYQEFPLPLIYSPAKYGKLFDTLGGTRELPPLPLSKWE